MMSKYKYTFVSLIVAVFFIFGSVNVMNYILRIREAQLLTERGRVEAESPVRAWENDKISTMSESVGGERAVLNTEQMEDAIKSWNNRTQIILHEPVSGQISMDEAIRTGKNWLTEMNIAEKTDEISYSINAELGAGEQMEYTGEKLEAYYSFWTVQYSNPSMYATLYINAVTGNVWGAEITLYGNPPVGSPYERLGMFAELAGLQIVDDDVIYSGECSTEIPIKGSQLYAQETIYGTVKTYKKTYENTSSDNYSDTIIVYRLLADEDINYKYITTIPQVSNNTQIE